MITPNVLGRIFVQVNQLCFLKFLNSHGKKCQGRIGRALVKLLVIERRTTPWRLAISLYMC